MNATATRSNGPVTGINLTIGFLALILNSIVFLVFLTTKELRYSLFYRLFFSITFFHIIASLAVVLQYRVILQDDSDEFLCATVPVLGSTSRIISISMTGIVAVDRYQASLGLVYSVLIRQRSLLGKIAIILCSVLLVTFALLVALYGNGDCISKQFYGSLTRIVSRVTAIWIVVCVFGVELPLCFMTFLNIRKACLTVGVQTSFMMNTSSSIMPSSTTDDRRNFPPPTVQKNMRLKIQALKVLSILVITHTIIFLPQLMIMIVFAPDENSRNYLYDYGMLLQAVNILIDPITCFLTITPFKKALGIIKLPSCCD